MICLRTICGVMRRIDRVRNEEIRGRCKRKANASERMDQSILRWFSDVDRLARKAYESEMQELRCRGRSYKQWMDSVKEVLGKWSLNIQEAKECM